MNELVVSPRLATVPEEPSPVRLWVKHMMTAGENETEEVWQQTLAAYKIAWQALRKKGPYAEPVIAASAVPERESEPAADSAPLEPAPAVAPEPAAEPTAAEPAAAESEAPGAKPFLEPRDRARHRGARR